MKEFYQAYALGEYVGHMEQLARIQQLTEGDGLERGNRLYRVTTGGGLEFSVNADRGFDITDFSFQGIPLRWRSANGDVNSKYHGDGQNAWARSFPGGLFVTGGLTQFGAANQDGEECLPLHGHVSNLPAWNVSARTGWENGRYKMTLFAEVRQSRLFGENLVLYRQYSTELGSTTVDIHDVVRNESHHTTPHMMLYHFNLGFPLVSPDAVLELQTKRTEARDAEAAAGLSKWDEFPPPLDTFKEQVFLHTLQSDPDKFASVHLLNRRLGVAFHLEYDSRILPYLYEWKMCEKGTYVLGIEPANCQGIEGRSAARRNGSLRWLEPREEVHYRLRVGVSQLN